MSHADASDGTDVTQDETTAVGAGAGTSSPTGRQDNATYTDRSLNSTDSSRRTDLRTTDDHYSWRQIAAACHVEPGR